MLSPDQIVFPNMPIGVFLQESFNIYNFIQDDKELFIKKGFNWGIMEEFPERMNYLRQKEAELWKEKYGENVIIKEYEKWKKIGEKAIKLLIRDLEYVFTNDPQMLSVIKKIKKDIGPYDLILDLNALSELVSQNKDKLERINSDPQLIQEINECSKLMPTLKSKYELEKDAIDNLMEERNRAYTLLAISIQDIRRCAQYALATNKKRLMGYNSEYFRKSLRKSKPEEPLTKR